MSKSERIVSCESPIELGFTHYLIIGVLSMHLTNMPIQKIANFFSLDVKALFDTVPFTMSVTTPSKKVTLEDGCHVPCDTHLPIVYLCFWKA